VTELLDDLATRSLELELLEGRSAREGCEAVLERLGPDSPLAARVWRTLGLSLFLQGDRRRAGQVLSDALGRAIGSFDRALLLDALTRVEPDTAASDARRTEADAIYAALGVTAPPPLIAADLVTTSAA
jgi:hypothetical protein